MLLTLQPNWWDDWLLYHKVIFDGENKLIYIADEVTALTVKNDFYSSWKEWVQLRDNAKFLPAFRTIGGDPVGGGQYAGDIYFLINDWQIIVEQNVKVTGILYHDNASLEPFIIMPGGGITSTVSNLAFAYNTSGASSGPTAAEIRTEIDSNSTQLAAIRNNQWTITERSQIRNRLGIDGAALTPIAAPTLATYATQLSIQSDLNSLSVTGAATNSAAISFTLNDGIVTAGDYTSTEALNGTEHVITDNATLFDIEYMFDIGLNAVPSSISIIGRAHPNQQTVLVSMWNYVTLQWDHIGNIEGSTNNKTYTFTLFKQFTGSIAGLIGDVRVRFTTLAPSACTFTLDQLYVSYVNVIAPTGFSGHAVSATTTAIRLGPEASSVNGYYVPSIVFVNHGTGVNQSARVVGYIGSIRELQLEFPMSTVLDSTSHITLSPWASTDVSTASIPVIANAVAAQTRVELTTELTHLMQIPTTGSLTTTQANMLLEMYNLLGLDPTIPLLVTQNSRVAGTINQNIYTDATQTIVTRV